jgi:hypothetical protein
MLAADDLADKDKELRRLKRERVVRKRELEAKIMKKTAAVYQAKLK